MTIAEDKFELTELLMRFIAGLRLEWISVSQVKILTGECISSDAQELMVLESDLTLDINIVGAGGRDAGVEAASTWYYIWLIKNLFTNQVSGVISASSAAPTLPSGYTKKRLLGFIRNNAASNFLNFESCGEGFQRTIFYIEPVDSVLQVLASGNAVVWTPISLATLVPPLTRNAILTSWVTSKDAWFRQSGTIPATQHLIAQQGLDFNILTDSNQNIDYYVLTVAGRVFVSVRGFCYRA